MPAEGQAHSACGTPCVTHQEFSEERVPLGGVAGAASWKKAGPAGCRRPRCSPGSC